MKAKKTKELSITLLLWALFTPFLLAGGNQPFDDKGYSVSPNFHTPMYTIAGITDWARDINYVYLITTIVCTLVFVAVCIPLIIAIRRFRVSDEDFKRLPPPKQIHGSAILEFTWTIVPVILLIFIAVPTWEVIFKMPTKAPENALRVKVIAHQWWWEFQYPDHSITTASEVHLPEDTPVFFEISSADVIHSFWIPQFGGKVDAMPGPGAENSMFVTTPLLVDKEGFGDHYQGQCAELCGLSHALMRFDAVVHSKEQFQEWLAQQKLAPVVASEKERRGEMLFNQCQSCHTIAGTPSEDLEKQMLSMNPPVHKVGPNLSNLGNRRTIAAGTRENTRENFKLWVKNSAAIKPGSLMTPFEHLSDDDLEALAAYLRYSTAKAF